MDQHARRGQCTIEVAILALALSAFVVTLGAWWPVERRGFRETQLSRGRR